MQNRKSIPFHLTNESHIECGVHTASRTVSRHWHDFYELELCVSGCGTTVINEKEYPLCEGALSFLSPSDFHSIKPEGEVKLFNLSFASYAIEAAGFYELIGMSGNRFFMLNEREMTETVSLLSLLERELTDGGSKSREYASHLLACLLIVLLRLHRSHAKDSPQPPSTVQKLLYYVHAHFKENISLEDAAGYAGLSTGYAGKLFAAHVGKPFKRFLTDLKLHHAERLLLSTDASVTEISYFCGFGSMTHFLRVFHERYGISPLAFRRGQKK